MCERWKIITDTPQSGIDYGGLDSDRLLMERFGSARVAELLGRISLLDEQPLEELGASPVAAEYVRNLLTRHDDSLVIDLIA